MTTALLAKLQQLIDCDPTKCSKTNCPNYYEEEDKCVWENIVSTFEIIMKEKFKDKNKEE